jgi:Peptidase family M23
MSEVRRSARVVAVLTAVLLPLAGCTTAPQPAQQPAPQPGAPVADNAAVLSPLAVVPLGEVNPVLGADNRVHLAYELLLANQSSSTVQLSSVATLDGDTAVSTLNGAALDRVLRPSGGENGTAFGPGESGYLFLDATLPPGTSLPHTIQHRFAMTLRAGPLPQDPDAAGADQQPAPARSLTFTGVPVQVSDQLAIEVAPPLRGKGWVVGNGCCDAITAHRGATLSINGTVRVAQRFAIDFVQLDLSGRLYGGDPAQNASFPFFGAEVHSVADGTVVGAQDGRPEQVPGALPTGQTVQTADGNFVVVDLGRGRFALYAHMQPGSLRVKVGDPVRTGDVLGLLGNTGNTDGPHLHFHVMDGPSPLTSDGLPFVFTSFTGQGVVTDEAKLVSPFPPTAPVVPVDATRLAGAHAHQLPLNLQVLDLGTGSPS